MGGGGRQIPANSQDPTMVHMFLSFLVDSLFVNFKKLTLSDKVHVTLQLRATLSDVA